MRLLNPNFYIAACVEQFRLLARHHQLTMELVKREFQDRYIGQVFGLVWAIGHPLVLMGVYVFIFNVVFQAKVGGSREMPLDFTAYLLAGLVPWLSTADAISKGCTSITAHAALVKQAVFPLEILPVKTVIASMITQLVMLVLLTAYVFFQGGLGLFYPMILVLLFFQILFLIGINYMLAAVGAYFRDLKDFVQVFCVAGIFLMPIFYLPESVPALFRKLLYVNPFSYMVWCYQDVVYFGRFEHPYAWGIFICLSLFSFCAGCLVFNRLKVMFGNVL